MLHIEDLRGGYAQVPVLNGIDLRLARAEVLAILGRNGAGKTTLLKALMGMVRVSGGQISLNGTRMNEARTFERARSGIAYVPQGRGIFGRLSVLENLRVGTRAQSPRHGAPYDIPEQVFSYFPILKERAQQVAGTLSGGQQQQLAIGRALASRPELLLLDEPSEGIQPNIVAEIGQLLPRIARDQGIAIIVVEQNIDLALAAASRYLVLEKGAIVGQGDSANDADRVHALLAL
jgi:branched-chain amino acid transport system ATP-binding protein